jgi:glutamyl/glutaminyl-tRNA synthetase
MRVQLGGQKYAKAKYDRFCMQSFSKDQILEKQANGESYIIRMKVPKGKSSFKDMVHGKVTFDNNVIDD